MRKLYILGLIGLACIIIGLAWAQGPMPGPQEITITTYYPAPYGVYNELTTRSNTYLATDSGNVGIGTTSPEAILDIDVGPRIAAGTHTGFLPPRMTTLQRDTIASPPQGSVIYNIDAGAEGLNHYDGSSWQSVGIGAAIAFPDAVVYSGAAPTSWTSLDLSGVVSANKALVVLKVLEPGGWATEYGFKPYGDPDSWVEGNIWGGGTTTFMSGEPAGIVMLTTDSNGRVEWISSWGDTTVITVLAYIR